MTLPRYSWKTFLGDCGGGLIAALIALPYGLAMATLMGLPPAMGLFTTLLTTPITALLGRNPVLIGGTSTVTVPFIAKAVADYGLAGAAKIALIAAVAMLVFSVLQWGRYIMMVPAVVVSGFSCGIGVMMIVSQLKTMFGVAVPGVGAQQAPYLQLFGFLSNIAAAQWQPALLALTVIAVAFLVAGRWRALPAPLIGVVASALAGAFLGLHQKEVGRLPLQIPPLASFTWSPGDLHRLVLPGLGLAFVASVNLLITSRVVEHFRGRQRGMKPSDADKELGAYGIANVAAAMFGAPISVGIPARSLANVRCGGSTRLSNVMHAVVLFVCLWLGADIVAHIPIASLAGVTAYVGICLLEWSTWRRLPLMRSSESFAFLVTCFATLFANAVVAVAAGCLIVFAATLPARWAPRSMAMAPR